MLKGKLLPSIYMIFISVFWMKGSFALVALDSLLLGSFSEQYQKDIEDPFVSIFSGKIYDEAKPGQRSLFKENLALYRAYIQEGQNLKNSCDKSIKPHFETTEQYNQVKRSYLATLQYTGLDLTARFLPHYAHYFEFSEQEYQNLIDGLVGNYCSQNLSVISLRQLKKNLLFKFKYKDKVELPSVLGNPLFPDSLDRLNTMNESRKREFAVTIDLFKSFCSWGGDIKNYRMLTSFVKDPVLAAHVIRSLAGEKIVWNEQRHETRIVKDHKPEQIMCKNFICRKVKPISFKRYFPKAVGSKDTREDVSRLYCHHMRFAEYQYKFQEPKIREMIKKSSFEHEHMMTGHMTALMTGVPHFLLQARSFDQAKSFFRSAVDRIWDDWANSQKNLHKRSLLYEESLTIEVVPKPFEDFEYKKSLNVNLDLNVGELDRISEVTGKISNQFNVRLTKQYMLWLKNVLSTRKSDQDIDQMTSVIESLEIRVNKELRELEEKLDIVPWRQGLAKIVARHILDQLVSYERVFGQSLVRDMTVPVQLNYGLFALRYIRYLHKSQEAKQRFEDEKRQNELLKKSLARSSSGKS